MLRFIRDFGPITPVMLRNALLIPILFESRETSMAAFRQRETVNSRWKERYANLAYSELKDELVALGDQVIAFQLANFPKKFDKTWLSHTEHRKVNPGGATVRKFPLSKV